MTTQVSTLKAQELHSLTEVKRMLDKLLAYPTSQEMKEILLEQIDVYAQRVALRRSRELAEKILGAMEKA